jgi:hypothetical protein
LRSSRREGAQIHWELRPNQSLLTPAAAIEMGC